MWKISEGNSWTATIDSVSVFTFPSSPAWPSLTPILVLSRESFVHVGAGWKPARTSGSTPGLPSDLRLLVSCQQHVKSLTPCDTLELWTSVCRSILL